MGHYRVIIKGDRAEDDGLQIDLGPVGGETGRAAWHEMPLPQCPDCDGDLVWYEAGYAPGTRKCMGQRASTLASSGEVDDDDSGCGSLFRVVCRIICGSARVVLQRERFYT